MKARRTLFLDFDGVLHPDGLDTLDHEFGLKITPRHFAHIPILAEVVGDNDVAIVVSSDWGRITTDEQLRGFLGPLSASFSGVMDWIPRASRADCIRYHASRHNLSDWRAVDDHASVRDAAAADKHFIYCNPDLGITTPGVVSKLRQWLRTE